MSKETEKPDFADVLKRRMREIDEASERWKQVRLADGRAESAQNGEPSVPSAAAPPDTETLLNGLIEECRSLLRDVAFRSACLTPDADERIRFLTAAQNLATTGANVGKGFLDWPAGKAEQVKARRDAFIMEFLRLQKAGKFD